MTDTAQPRTMPAITVHQPGATFLAFGHRRHEVRSWRPGDNLIGARIAIHAARKRPARISDREQARLRLDAHAADASDLPYGAIIATAVLTGVVPAEQVSTSVLDRALNDFTPGAIAWRFDHHVRLDTPIPALGAMGFWSWDIPDDVDPAILGLPARDRP